MTKDDTPRNLLKSPIVWIAAIVCVLVAVIYFTHWRGGYSSNHEHWGQFGDFFGGVLNPALSFLGLIALLETVRLQRNELTQQRLSRASQDHINAEQARALRRSIALQNRQLETEAINLALRFSSQGIPIIEPTSDEEKRLPLVCELPVKDGRTLLTYVYFSGESSAEADFKLEPPLTPAEAMGDLRQKLRLRDAGCHHVWIVGRAPNGLDVFYKFALVKHSKTLSFQSGPWRFDEIPESIQEEYAEREFAIDSARRDQ